MPLLAMNHAPQQVTINPERVVKTLTTLMLILVVTGFFANFCRELTEHPRLLELITYFHLDHENNFPTYFSVLLLGFCALLLAIIASHFRTTRKKDGFYWVILCAGFLFMGFDEAFALHERLGKPMRQLLGEGDLGIFYFTWVVPGMILVAGLGLIFLGFLKRLETRHRNAFLLAAGLYLGGCLGVELIAGSYVESHGWTMAYQGLVVAEEGLEMLGLITFIGALLTYLGELLPGGVTVQAAQRDELNNADASQPSLLDDLTPAHPLDSAAG